MPDDAHVLWTYLHLDAPNVTRDTAGLDRWNHLDWVRNARTRFFTGEFIEAALAQAEANKPPAIKPGSAAAEHTSAEGFIDAVMAKSEGGLTNDAFLTRTGVIKHCRRAVGRWERRHKLRLTVLQRGSIVSRAIALVLFSRLLAGTPPWNEDYCVLSSRLVLDDKDWLHVLNALRGLPPRVMEYAESPGRIRTRTGDGLGIEVERECTLEAIGSVAPVL